MKRPKKGFKLLRFDPGKKGLINRVNSVNSAEMGDPSNIEIGWRSALMFGVCFPLLIVSILLLLRQVERAANAFLGGFLLIAVVAQIPQIIGFAGAYDVWPGLTFAPFNVELYAGPLLYLHADRLMQDRPLAWRKWLIVPGLFQSAYYTWAYLFLGDYKSKWAYNNSIHEPWLKPIETILGLTLLVIAIVAVRRMIKAYRKFLDRTQSAARDFDPVWLDRLLFAIIAAGIVFFGLEIASLIVPDLRYVDAFPAEIVMTSIIAWLGLEALMQTSAPFPKIRCQSSLSAPSRNPERDWVHEGTVLRKLVLESSWHLEPRLSIGDLASRVASNETYVSRALNIGLGVSFNTFINSLRVEHARRLIIQGERSMLDVALDSGFNSKATFNRVFRDLEGRSPSEFKKSQNP